MATILYWIGWGGIGLGVILLSIGGIVHLLTDYHRWNEGLLEAERQMKKFPFLTRNVGFDLDDSKSAIWLLLGGLSIVIGFVAFGWIPIFK